MIMANVKCRNFEITDSDVEVYMSGSMTLVDLAKLRGVSRHTMIRWLHKTGRPDVISKISSRRYRDMCDENQKTEAIKRLECGWKVDAISLDTGISTKTIRKLKKDIESQKEYKNG